MQIKLTNPLYTKGHPYHKVAEVQGKEQKAQLDHLDTSQDFSPAPQ
jgi:hypothetical protein